MKNGLQRHDDDEGQQVMDSSPPRPAPIWVDAKWVVDAPGNFFEDPEFMQRPDVALWEAEKEKIFTLYGRGRKFGDDGEAESITRRRQKLIARHFPRNTKYRTTEYATITAERCRQQTQLFRDLETAKQNQNATKIMPYMVRLVYYVYYDLERKNLIESRKRRLIRDDCRAWRKSESERRSQLRRIEIRKRQKRARPSRGRT